MAKEKQQPITEEVIPQELLKRSGFKLTTDTQSGKPMIVPDKMDSYLKNLDKMRSGMMGTPVSSPGELYNLFNYYIQHVLEVKTQERMKRYDQMDFILENDGALSMTRSILVDEIAQADIYKDPISVMARKKSFKRSIEKLLKELGMKSFLREIGNNIITYGDSFMIMDIDKNLGVTRLVPIDVRDVQHRFEFSIAEVKRDREKLIRRFPTMDKIINTIANSTSTSALFTKILLGFQINNIIFPYWQVLHFRNFTTKKNIAPFGKPFFFEAQSAVRMYLNGKVVANMIRSSAFMKEIYNVKTNPSDDPVSQFQTVSEIRNAIDLLINMGSARSQKDVPSFGDKIFIPDGLVKIEQQQAGVNLRDRYEDLAMLRDDVYLSTGLPKEYFEGSTGGTYQSNMSIISQDKKTARKVYALQTTIIDQMIKLIEVHYTYNKSEGFNPFIEEFALSLPYPASDTDMNKITSDSSKLNLATEIINQLKMALNITRIPEPVVAKLLKQYFPLDDSEINSVLTQMRVDSGQEQELGYNRLGALAGDPFLQNKQTQDINIAQQQQAAAAAGTPVDPNQPQQPADPNQAQPQAKVPPADTMGYGTPISNQGPSYQLQSFDYSTSMDILQEGLKTNNLDELRQLSQKMKNQMEAESIRQEMFGALKNQKDMNEFLIRMKTSPVSLGEAAEQAVETVFLARGDSEFTTQGMHFVSNGYKSECSDRNITIVEKAKKSQDPINLLKEIHTMKSGSFKVKVTEDTVLDKRYLRESESEGRSVLPSLKDLQFKDERKRVEEQVKAKKKKYLL